MPASQNPKLGASSSGKCLRHLLPPPPARPRVCLIFLHGVGDSGKVWELKLRRQFGVTAKVVCPTAPPQPVALYHGLVMNSWFDMSCPSGASPKESGQIKQAAQVRA